MTRALHARRRRHPLAAWAGASVVLVALGLGVVAVHPWRSATALPTPTSKGRTGSPTTSTRIGETQSAYESAVHRVLRERQGVVGVAVEDLLTGRTWTVGSTSPQYEASIVKVEILITLLYEDHLEGRGPTSQQMALSAEMIELSDNDAATQLWADVMGAAGLSALDHVAGLRETTPSPCLQCGGFPWPGWGLTTTSPRDQIRLLDLLTHPNPLLSTWDRRYVRSLMEHVAPYESWGVSSGAPPEAAVALKNGWLPLHSDETDWQINSIGWIQAPGSDYLIAVLTGRNPTESYGIATISAVVRVLSPFLTHDAVAK